MKKIQQFIILLAVLTFAAAGNDAKAQTDDENVCAAVSPINMNVLYCGLPNPLEIAVSGYKPDDIQVSISQGTITNVQGQPGKYTAVVNNPGYTDIIISSNGKTLVTKRFRSKLIPTPTALVGGKHTGAIFSKAELMAQAGIKAVAEDFEYDLKYEVLSFTLSVTIDGEVKSESSASSVFTAEQRKLIGQSPSGSKIYIFDIKAKGPDGRVRDLQPLIYELK